MKIDLEFPVSGRFPVSHEYALFGAISNIVPEIHCDKAGLNGIPVAISRISGNRNADYMESHESSRFIIRTDEKLAYLFFKVANSNLSLSRLRIDVGNPSIKKIHNGPVLESQRVIISMGSATNISVDNFLASVKKQIPGICTVEVLKRVGVAIKERTHIGFKVKLSGMEPDVSMHVLENGIGGRQKYGCGIFFASKNEK